MKHFVYKTEAPNGQFYIGKHSTNNINDGYIGSGNWIKSIDKSIVKRTILEFCTDTEELIDRETSYIRDNFFNPNCMNINDKSTGWIKGKLRGNCWNKGISWPTEILEKNRLSNINARKLMPLEYKIAIAQSISIANKGKKKPQGFAKKISEKLSGISKSETHKVNIGAASKNTKFINNGAVNTKVKVDKLPEYLNNGWVLGMLKAPKC